MEADFKVKTGEFEGPLDLLLDLVEARKMHINQVSLAQVADEYVTYLKDHPAIKMGEMANFILVASTLMLIKSLALLPNLAVSPEEQGSIEDLERRLQALAEFRRLSVGVKGVFGQNISFPRAERRLEPVFTPSEEIKPQSLLNALRAVLAALPKPEKIPETIVKKVMSLEEMITNLAARVTSALKLKFSDFVKEHKGERVAVIVSFLGMLELVKQGVIEVRQDTNFAEIDMETKTPSTPRY